MPTISGGGREPGGRRDDADPLPQLGLGCSKVSAGSLSEIKSNLGELAVSNLVHHYGNAWPATKLSKEKGASHYHTVVLTRLPVPMDRIHLIKNRSTARLKVGQGSGKKLQ